MTTPTGEAWQAIGAERAAGGMVIIGDHASAHVPEDVDLGIAADVLTRHVAIDIGVAPLAEALCDALGCDAILGGVSRLVCDFNREEDAPGLFPIASDGIWIYVHSCSAAP